MAAPVCGCSTMSLRSVVRKRPLRARSSLTSWATSNEAAAASGELNGTMAMGMASACPFVISTTSCAQLREQNNMKPIAAKTEMCLFIGLEPKYEVSFKERRVRRIRQGRCSIHRVFDRLPGGRVAVALSHACTRHLAARNLGYFDQTIKTDARGRRLDPCTLDSIAEPRDIAVPQGAGFGGAAVFLVGQLSAQFGLAVLPGAVIGGPLGIGGLLRFGLLLGFRSLLGFRGFPGVEEMLLLGGRGLGLLGGFSLLRGLGLFARLRLLSRRPGLISLLGLLGRLRLISLLGLLDLLSGLGFLC